MDILLKKNRKHRLDCNTRIAFELENPTNGNYSEIDFEFLCKALNVDHSNDESNQSDCQSTMSNESQRFVGDKIAAALMLKGIGYNLNDHFVDDTELPSTVPFVETPIRTLYSGFFVNVDDSIKAQENPEIENSHNLSEEKENLQAEKLIIKKLQSQIPDRRAQNEFQISAGPLRPTSNSAIAMARPNVANLATNPIESAPFFQSLHNLQPPPAPAASVNRKRAYCRCQNDCKNNRCGCYKAKVPCSDRCHKAKTCTNVNPIN